MIHTENKIYKITPEKISAKPDLISGLYYKAVEGGYLFQIHVKQHSYMNTLIPSCINTIRFDTFADK